MGSCSQQKDLCCALCLCVCVCVYLEEGFIFISAFSTRGGNLNYQGSFCKLFLLSAPQINCVKVNKDGFQEHVCSKFPLNDFYTLSYLRLPHLEVRWTCECCLAILGTSLPTIARCVFREIMLAGLAGLGKLICSNGLGTKGE